MAALGEFLPQKTSTQSYADAPSGIPKGFPKVIVSPSAWTGVDFSDESQRERCNLVLDESYIKELEQACMKFEGLSSSKIIHRVELTSCT